MKSAIETLKRNRIPMREITGDDHNSPVRQQRRCLLCGKPGHYQKKCPNSRNG
jgi:ribosomal protein S14